MSGNFKDQSYSHSANHNSGEALLITTQAEKA